MRNTTTTVVIAAGVVLAAVIVTRTPGQTYGKLTGACCTDNGGCIEVMSEECQEIGGVYQGHTTLCVNFVCEPTSPPPTVVAATSVSIGTNDNRLYRVWSDGQVDTIQVPDSALPCPGLLEPCVIVTGTCPTDINRDGDTGIQDFLTLLGGWGACR